MFAEGELYADGYLSVVHNRAAHISGQEPSCPIESHIEQRAPLPRRLPAAEVGIRRAGCRIGDPVAGDGSQPADARV